MNDYQILQDIGKSKSSLVYKGRKKKTVEFYALKCVDKSQKQKIMREVRFLHRLTQGGCRYSIKFFEWFETSNHLWLILELCPGNRLLELLQLDLKLPEASLNSMALNLLAALQFLHCNGIVYNNLKPSSVMIDSQGLLKLADFSLAIYTKDLTDPKSDEGQRCKRGTPTYMAPELFRPDGVSSYSSDLWALGCIMYEMASGRPPFLKSNFKALVTSIVTEPYIPLPLLSDEFNQLCTALLMKSPLDRPSWEEVRTSRFWMQQLLETEMPPQPGYAAMVKQMKEERRQVDASEGRKSQGQSPKEAKPSRDDELRKSNVDVKQLTNNLKENRMKKAAGSYKEKTTRGGQHEDVRPDEEVDFGANANEEEEEEGAAADKDQVEDSGVEEYGQEEADAPGISPFAEGEVAPGGGRGRPISVMSEQEQERPLTAFTAGGEGSMAAAASELLFFAGDLQVRPIVNNRKIERIPPPAYDAKTLPFKAVSATDVEAQSPEEQEPFIASINRALGDKTSITDKVGVLGYLEKLSSSAVASDAVINSTLGHMFIRIMRATKSEVLRTKVAHVLGMLVRNATYISPELQQDGALLALTEGVRDRDVKVRRKCMAGLGELLYYVASQDEGEDGVEGEGEQWALPASALQVLVRGIRSGEDEVVQHYAVQAVDNLASQTNDKIGPLRTMDTVSNLTSLINSSQLDLVRGTAASAISRLVRASPALASQILDKVGAAGVYEMLADDNARVQQAFLNVLNVALLEPSARLLKALVEDELLPILMRLLEHTAQAIRAKALLTIRLLTSASASWLAGACDRKLMPCLDKLTRDKDPYLTGCVQGLVETIGETLEPICTDITTKVNEVSTSKKTSKPPQPGAELRPLKAPLSYVTVLLHVSTAGSTRMLPQHPVIQTLADSLLVTAEQGVVFESSHEFRRVLYILLEAVSQQQHLLLQNHTSVVTHLLPALVAMATSEEGRGASAGAPSPKSAAAAAAAPAAPAKTDGAGIHRFNCIKALADMLPILMNDKSVYDPSLALPTKPLNTDGPVAATKQINQELVRHLLPKLSTLLGERDPTAQHAIRACKVITECNPAYALVLQRLGLIPKLLELLDPAKGQASPNAAILVKSIVVGLDDAEPLYAANITEKLGKVVEHMVDEGIEELFEPTLDILSSLLMAVLQDEETMNSDAGHVLWTRRFTPLLAAANQLASLCFPATPTQIASDDGIANQIQTKDCENAAQCLLLLAHLYPSNVLQAGEAADYVVQGLHCGNATIRKRLLKTILWIAQAGEVSEIEGALAQVEEGVRECMSEAGVVGELAQETMTALEQCLGFDDAE